MYTALGQATLARRGHLGYKLCPRSRARPPIVIIVISETIVATNEEI
jgi:hypothetical protein